MADVASLVVALSAQLSQFQRDMEKAGAIADGAVKGIEEAFGKMNPDASGALKSFSDSAQQPAQAAGASIGQAVLVGFTGAIALIITRLGLIVDGLAKIGDRAEDLRLPVNLLQALSVAADEARLPQENLNKALDQFTKVSKQTREDAEAFYKALSNIGEGFATAFERAPTQAARLEVLRSALRSTTDEVKRSQLLMEAFKTDSERAFQVFANIEGLDKAQQKLKALGLEIDESAVQKAQEARSQLSLLARVLTDELSSALAGLIPTFVSLLPYMKALSATAKDVIAIFQSENFKGIGTLEREAATLGQEIKKLDDQLESLGIEAEEPKTSLKKAGEETKQALQEILIAFKLFTKSELEETDVTIKEARDKLLAALDATQQRIRELRKSGEAQGTPTTGQGGAFKGRPSLTGGDETDAFDKQVDSINRHIAALNADAAAIGKTAGVHEQLRAEIQLLQAIERSEGEVTQEQIDRYGVLRASMTQQQALTAAGINLNKEHADSFSTVSQRMLQAASAADQAKKNYAGLQSAIQFGGNQLIDIMDGLRNKTLSASDAMKNLTNNLIKALEQALLLGGGPLAGLLGTTSPAGAGSAGGLLGGLFNSFSGPKATGGGVSGGRSYLVGEHGPELFMPNTSGNIFPSSVSGGAGGGGNVVEINNYVAADTESRQTQQSDPGGGERIIIDIVKKAQARGAFDDSSRGRFALRPQKVR